MSGSSMVHVRIDNAIKLQATEALAAMGLSVSDAVRMLLVRTAAEKALPFEVRVPNAVTLEAMQELQEGKGKRYKNTAELFKDIGI